MSNSQNTQDATQSGYDAYGNPTNASQNPSGQTYPTYQNQNNSQQYYAGQNRVSQMISEGRIHMNGENSGGFRENIARSVGDYAIDSTRQDENIIYENSKRLDKAMAVMSLVQEDYYKAQERDAYQSIDFTSQSTQNDMASLGVFQNNRQTQFDQTINNYFQQQGVGTVPNFDASDYKSIADYGRVTKNGQVFDFSGNSEIRERARAALQETTANELITRAHGIEAQSAAIAQMRHQALEHLQSDACVELTKDFVTGSTVTRDGLRYFTGDAKQLRELAKGNSFTTRVNGQNVTITLTDSQASKARTFASYFSGKENEGHSMNSMIHGKRQSALKNMIAREMLGDEMYQGITTVRQIGRIAQMSASAAYRSAAAIGCTGMAGSNWFVQNTGLKDLRIGRNGKTLGGLTGSADELLKTRAKEAKALAGAKKNGSFKQQQIEIRNKRKARKIGRQSKKEIALQQRFANRPTRMRIHNAKKDLKYRISRAKKSITSPFKRMGASFSNARHTLLQNRFVKLLGKPFEFTSMISQALAGIKLAILKYGGIFLGVILIFILICGAITTALGYMVTLFDSEQAYGIQNLLANINFTQAAVDATSEELQGKYLEVAKRDCDLKANFGGFDDQGKWVGWGEDAAFHAEKSSRYNWYLEGTEADIGTYYDENNKEVPNFSNLLQITSLMHARYQDSLNLDNYYSMKGYMYYMWVQTHRVRNYDWLRNSEGKVIEDYCSTSVDSPPATCTNQYYHGYQIKYSARINKAKKGLADLLGIDPFDGIIFREDDPNVVAHGGVPYDDVGICTNFKIVLHTGEKDWLKEKIDGKNHPDEHKHGTGCKYECTHRCSSDPDCTATKCSHTTCGSDCQECIYKEHTHSASCYAFELVCLGHCGGHATPAINFQIDTDWEAIAEKDGFKTTYFMSPDDFDVNIFEAAWTSADLKLWTKFWNERFKLWFIPFPSAGDIYFQAWKSAVDLLVWREQMSGKLWKWFADGEDFEFPGTEEEAMEKSRDQFDFDGWFLADENGGPVLDKNGHPTLDPSKMDELRDWYGVREDDFEEGVKMWEDFDVVFPAGEIRPLTSKEKQEILEYVSTNKGIKVGSDRYKVLSKGLDFVGKFTYNITNPAEKEATSGRIDCSGFVSSVLYHADIGWTGDGNNNWTACTFAKKGSIRAKKPGDAVAKSRTSYYAGGKWVNGESNHVYIYVGHLEKGVGGVKETGEYVIDCSSSKNGSSLREIGNMDSYQYAYFPK